MRNKKMIINVDVQDKKENTFLNPVDVFGSPFGNIYRQYMRGSPTKDFLIGTGPNSRPIFIWHSKGTNEYHIGSQDKKELKQYYSYIKFKKVEGTVELNLKIG